MRKEIMKTHNKKKCYKLIWKRKDWNSSGVHLLLLLSIMTSLYQTIMFSMDAEKIYPISFYPNIARNKGFNKSHSGTLLWFNIIFLLPANFILKLDFCQFHFYGSVFMYTFTFKAIIQQRIGSQNTLVTLLLSM